jgi:hypothetical protein
MHQRSAWRQGVLGLGMCVLVCGAPGWTKPGCTDQDWAVDRAVCEREAHERTYFHTGMARAKALQRFLGVCLEAKGYRAMPQ